jgi:hypothetical protein
MARGPGLMTSARPSAVSAIRTRLWAWTRPDIGRLVYANGGLGDELMLTAICRAARQAGTPLDVLTDLPEIWRGNRDAASIQRGVERWFYAVRRGWVRTEIRHLAYRTGEGPHIAEQMAARAGISLAPGWAPVVHVQKAETRDPNLIVVQNACRGARFFAPTKEWPQASWEALCRRLGMRFSLVQLGTALDPGLPGVRDLRGKTTLAEAAAWLSRAAVFVGLESGLMHLAAATATPAVIVYGGRSTPGETGYPSHRTIVRRPPCSPCALNDGCPHGMACMDIPPSEVEERILSVLDRP